MRIRLTVWYVAILAGVMLLFGGGAYAIDQQLLLAHLERVHARLQDIARAYDPHTRHLSPQGIAQQQTSELIFLVTPQGTVIQEQAPGALMGNQRSELILPALKTSSKGILAPSTYDQWVWLRSPAGERQHVVYRLASMPILSGGHVDAVLVVGLQSDVSSQLATLVTALTLAMPLVLLICAGSGYWLAARAMRPVRAITRTVRQIEETDLSRRLNLRRRDELGELAATFDEMLDRLEAAFARQRQFTADAGHELRTPLAAATLIADRVLNQPREPEDYRTAIRSMQRELDYMTRLANDLLMLARADRGEGTLHTEEVDLGEIVLDVVDRLAPLAQQHHMSIVLGQVLELPAVGDRTSLTQLLMNVVENAVTHGAKGGDRVCIDMTDEQRDGIRWACVRVRDNGPGIAAEHLPRLFDRFYRVDQARTRREKDVAERDEVSRSGGSGLGLAIAHSIAQGHHGDIRVETDVGRGTAFEIRVPAVQVEGAAPSSSRT